MKNKIYFFKEEKYSEVYKYKSKVNLLEILKEILNYETTNKPKDFKISNIFVGF